MSKNRLDCMIARVLLRYSAPVPLSLPAPRATDYTEFAASDGVYPSPDADLVVDLPMSVGCPFRPAGVPLFDADAWKAYRGADPTGRWLDYRLPGAAQPIWQASVTRDPWRVDVYRPDQRVHHGNDGRVDGVDVPCYPLDQLLMAHVLPVLSGVCVHGAGVVLDGRGCLLPGQSGAGKSTFSRQVQAAGGATILSDDRIVIRATARGPRMFGTPWPGELGIARNASAPLRAIMFLCQADENRVVEISPAAAAEGLLRLSTVLWYERDLMDLALDAVDRLVRAVPAFELRCRAEPAAAETMYATLSSL